MFEPPDLDNVARESGCWKTAHFALKNTKIVGDFLHQKKKKGMHWFPEALLKKGDCREIVSLVETTTSRTQTQLQAHDAQNLSLRCRIYWAPTPRITQFGKKSPHQHVPQW